MGFLEELGDLIDRPCQRKECGRFVPESSPSDDFCSEICESAWRAENNGCEYVRGFGGGEVLVPEGHPAEPTHRPPSTDVTVSAPGGMGIFQILSSEWERYDFAARRENAERSQRGGLWDGFDSYRDWVRSVMQYSSPASFAEPPQGPRAHFHIGSGYVMRADGSLEQFVSVDPAYPMRPLSEGESRVPDLLAYASDIVSRRQEMQRTIADIYGIPVSLLGSVGMGNLRYGGVLWSDIPHFDDRSHIVCPRGTMRQEWAEQCRDDGDWLLDTLDIALEFLIYDAPDAIVRGARRAWRFVTRS